MAVWSRQGSMGSERNCFQGTTYWFPSPPCMKARQWLPLKIHIRMLPSTQGLNAASLEATSGYLEAPCQHMKHPGEGVARDKDTHPQGEHREAAHIQACSCN